MAPEDDSEVPETGAVFTFGKSKFAENVPNKFWVRKDKVFITACGDEHTALVAESGRIFTFGCNDWGQLGLGHTKSVTKPSCVKSLKHEKIKLAACGRTHTIVATESGLLYSFGANGENQLGVNDTPGCNSPKCIDTLEPAEYLMLAAGADHSVALTAEGQVLVWGSGSEGQLGLGAETECHKPKPLPFEKSVVCIACGYYHTALVTDDGELYTFGESEDGKLGLGEDPDEYDTPQLVTAISERVKWVSCGGSHTVAVTEKGKVYTFGNGANGQLGHGTMALELSVPHMLTSPDVKFVYSSCGENHTALVTEKGNLYTFGDGRHGKLGLGMESFANQFKPCKVKRFDKLVVEKVSCGGCHMLALAHPRLQNGTTLSDDDEEDVEIKKSPRIDSLKADGSLDLNGSISARDRRRQISPMPSFNRTLPTLSSMKSLPPLNSTLPALSNGQSSEDPLSKSLLPSIDISKEKSLKRQNQLESDSDEDGHVTETIQKVTTADVHTVPSRHPKPVPRRRGEQKKGTENGKVSRFTKENDDDSNISDKDTVEAPIPSPRSDKSKKSEDEIEEVEKHREENEDIDEDGDEDDDDEKEDKSKKKDKKKDKDKKEKETKKKKDKKKGGGIFGRKKIESEDEDEEEEDIEEIEDEEEEKALKKKGKDKDKKKDKDDKKKKKGKDEEEEDEGEEDDKGKKKKDKKDKGKDKKKKDKKKKKDEDEDEEDEEEDEEEEKDTKKKKDKDKKSKEKDKKDKKDKDKDKDTEDKEDMQEEDDEKLNVDDDARSDKQEDKSEKKDKDSEKKEEEKKPTKKSRTCTIL